MALKFHEDILRASLVFSLLALALLSFSMIYASSTNYEYIKPDLTSFSQYYDKSWGTHWCVPTASGICLNYWAKNGYPNLVPDSDNDGDVDEKDLASVIDILGKRYMSTDPHGGTALRDVYNGLMKYISDRGYGGNLTVTWFTSPQSNWFKIYSTELGKCEDVLVVLEYLKTSGAHMLVGRAFTSSYNQLGGHDVSFVDPADKITSNVMWDNGSCDYGGKSIVTDIFSISPYKGPLSPSTFKVTGIVFVHDDQYFIVTSYEEGVPPYFDVIYVTEDGYVTGVEGEVLWVPEAEYIACLANYTVIVFGGKPQPIPPEFWGRVLLDGSRIIRENEPPIPQLYISNSGISLTNDTLIFDASESYDPDGEIVEYRWDFGDGTIMTTSEPIVEHVYTTPGRYWVSLSVKDDMGISVCTLSEIAIVNKTTRRGLSFTKPNLEKLSQYHDVSWKTHWCVPTSLGVCLGYWAENGYPKLIPDTNNNGRIDENDKYKAIDVIGKNYTHTSPTSGTTVRNAIEGARKYINDKGYGGKLTITYFRNPTIDQYAKELAKCEDVLVCLSYLKSKGGHMVVGEGYNMKKSSDGSYNVSFIDPASKSSVTVKLWPNMTCSYGGGAKLFGLLSISPFNPPPISKYRPPGYSEYRLTGLHVQSHGFDFVIASYGDYMPSFDFVYIDEKGVAHGIEGGYLLYIPEGFVYGFANGTVVIYGHAPQSVYPEELWGLIVIEGNYTIVEAEPPIVTLKPLEVEVEQGSLATFNCSASYDPNPNGEITSINWYLNGSLIAHNAEAITLSTSSLSQGAYIITVEATSIYGTKWSEQSILKVYTPERVLTTIMLASSQCKVNVGSEVVFTVTCLDQEDKPLAGIEVEVYINGMLIGATQPTNDEGQATISHTFQKAGEYTIKAVYGEVESNEVKVVVEEVAKFDVYMYVALGAIAIIIIAIVIMMKLR